MLEEIEEVKTYFLNLQKTLCTTFSKEEPTAPFIEDHWQREEEKGGGGITCVLSNGTVLERAGVNFSHILGKDLPSCASLLRPDLKGTSFQALGVSVVIHPKNPFVPTTHANFRFFVCEKQNGQTHWWFGGGFDLTPYFPFEADCLHWHSEAKSACDPFGKTVYPRFKRWCDEYFFLKHRQEPRGIGGLFFDDLNEWPFETCFDFIKSTSQYFIKAYQPILHKRKETPYTDHERAFQCYRRGRYVEFNLIYDRGTLFGLQSGGRTESILMSLPPEVHWHSNQEISKRFAREEENLKKIVNQKEWTQPSSHLLEEGCVET